MPKLLKFKHNTNYFVETGSYIGDGIQLAIDSDFENIYSIEISDKHYELCRNRFLNNNKVNLIKGDSYEELGKLLENIKEPFTYWLDGHYSGPGTGLGVLEFPIMTELDTILKRGIDGETIYVDDMRILKNYDDSINLDKILDLVKKYKSDYKIYYEDSILHSGDFLKDDIMVIEY
jgi:hypothetical protein